MSEETLFETEKRRPRTEIAEALADAADRIESGTVRLEDGTEAREVAVPGTARLERFTDPETGEERYELEYEVGWTR